MIWCFPTRSLLTFILGRRVSIDQGSTPWTEISPSMAGVKTIGATTQVLKLAQSKMMMMLLLRRTTDFPECLQGSQGAPY
jgi:hypothetical protein